MDDGRGDVAIEKQLLNAPRPIALFSAQLALAAD